MHEQHQVQKLINEVLEQVSSRNAKKVTKITVAMGDALGFDEGSVRLYFETLGEGTLLENAEIIFHPIKGKLHCRKCGKYFEKVPKTLNCPTCKEQGIPTNIGKEFFAEKIETL